MKDSEERKEMFSVMINICTRVVTLIFIISTLVICLSGNAKDIRWTILDIWGVLFIGIASGVCFGLFYIKKNLTAKQSLCIHVIYFLILNCVLLVTGLKLGWFVKKVSSLVTMEIMFVVIYFAVSCLVYLFDFNEAKKINQKIQDRKNDRRIK